MLKALNKINTKHLDNIIPGNNKAAYVRTKTLLRTGIKYPVNCVDRRRVKVNSFCRRRKLGEGGGFPWIETEDEKEHVGEF